MPENISFNQIPVDIRTPGQYIEIDNSKAVQGLPTIDRKILVLGQRLTGGSVAEGVPTRILNGVMADDSFGRGSQLASMLKAVLDANQAGDVWAIALDDLVAGVVATGTITIAGTITGSGTLNLMIAGVEVKVGVTAGDTPTEVATATAAAINAKDDLPVTATSALGVVTVTARHKGETGNDIDIRVNYYQGQVLPVGMTVAIVAMASGTGNPDIATAITSMADDQYYTIVTPWTDAANMTALENELSDRFGPMTQITGHAFAAVSGTHAALTTYGVARNSPHTTVIGAKSSPTPPWMWAAWLAGTCEFYGAIDPARPFQTLQMVGLLPPLEADRFNRNERDLLLHDGISTFTVDAGGRVVIERVITTYQKNSAGVDDVSFLDLNTVWTVDYIRFAVKVLIALRYPRYKLANDDTQIHPGQAIVRPKDIRAELIGLFKQLEEAGLVEDFEQYKADLLVVRSNSDVNRVNAVIPPNIINQFRVFAAAVQFRL